MNNFQRTLLCCATMGNLLFAGGNAVATELGTLCWQTESGNLLRFSVSEAGPGHYTYTGMFADTDGAEFAIVGHVEATGGALVGSFSGAKTTADNFKTAIYRVTFNPGTMVGFGEGIRQRYDRASTNVSTEYRTHTLTPTTCT